MLEDDHEVFRIDARRRLVVMGGLTGALFSVLGGRLFYLQVLRGGDYRDLAEDNRISLEPIPPPRGRIFDRFGEILVENRPDYRLAVIPELTDGRLTDVLARLQPFLTVTESEIEAILRQARRQRSFLPVRVKSHLTWDELSRVEARIHNFPGAIIQIQSRRHYPFGSLGAHVLGYLGEVNDQDKRAYQGIRFRSGDLVGKTGMERHFETSLRGREGVREMEVNALGRQVRELDRTPPQPGADLYLTLNISLQREVEAALADNAGAVVVMDPRTGEVLAMASSPAYDPNQFIRGFSTRQWRELVSDPGRPLTNKAIQGQYPPGSTFKIVVCLAGLAENRIQPGERLRCDGFVEREGLRFHCWKRSGHGSLDMVQALAQSCDVYFYKLAERLGIDAIAQQALALGLGQTTGIPLSGEQPGLMPSRQWKRARHNAAWFPGETLINAIGQGFVLATPLQLASMMSVIANGGALHRPALVRPVARFQPEIVRRVILNPEHLAVVRTGLEAVVNGPTGTARLAAPELVRAAGKTGTSQVIRQRREESGRAISHDDPRFRDHSLFIAYAPLDNPELALSVVVEHGGGGSKVAAPMAKRIMDGYFGRLLGLDGSGPVGS